jgi:methyl-galactoside transport system substrate-binding protein
LAAGCNTDSKDQQASGKPVVGVLVYRQDDTYISLVTKALVATLSDKADVTVLYAESDQIAQNEQIDALLQKKNRRPGAQYR